MTEETIYWATSLIALIGVALNIHKHVACFYLWCVTNAVWAIADYTHGLEAQAFVQTVYFALSIYGIYKWRRRGRDRGGADDGPPQ